MSSDLDLQNAQDEHDEWRRWQQAKEAATYIISGDDRPTAIYRVKEIYRAQADAGPHEVIHDEDGFPDFLMGEAQTPIVSQDPQKLRQIEAIAKEILDSFD